MTTAVRTPPHHNNTTCFKYYGCRLPACHQRYLAYQRESRRRRNENGITLIDATPVRDHIRTLYAAEFTDYRIAKLAHTSAPTIHALGTRPYPKTRGKQQRVSPDLAARILAINPDTAQPGLVPAIGAQRRIQALAAAGWPMYRIATQAGLNVQNLHRIFHQTVIKVSTDRAIAAAYDQLRELRSDRAGIPIASVRRARNHARAKQWAPISYWDRPEHPIDDADFECDYGVSRAKVIADEGRWLLNSGCHPDHAARRLGVSRFYLDRSLRDYPADEQAAA